MGYEKLDMVAIVYEDLVLVHALFIRIVIRCLFQKHHTTQSIPAGVLVYLLRKHLASLMAPSLQSDFQKKHVRVIHQYRFKNRRVSYPAYERFIIDGMKNDKLIMNLLSNVSFSLLLFDLLIHVTSNPTRSESRKIPPMIAPAIGATL